METRVALISIIIENPDAVEKVNAILHDGADYIIGRMGLPYREKKINIISVAIDGPQTLISQLSGRLGQLCGVSAKTTYSNVRTAADGTVTYD